MVKIHPKDSGPIDTDTHTHCDNCNHDIARSGKYCYDGEKSPRRRNKKSWHTKYYKVCPKCKEPQSKVNSRTIKCGNCRNYIDEMELKKYSSNDTANCPICDSEVTKENSTVVNDL